MLHVHGQYQPHYAHFHQNNDSDEARDDSQDGDVQRSRARNTVQEDNRDVNRMIQAAKNGNFREVYKVVGTPENPKKDFLLNCIPENRRWGVIQQAVWWRNTTALKTLLKFPSCDLTVKAKEGASEIGPDGGKTALEIAQAFGYSDIVGILQKGKSTEEVAAPDTFQPYAVDNENEFLGLVRITIAAYKNAFCPNKVESSKSLLAVMNEIYRDMNTSESRWKCIRDKICESAYTVCSQTCERIRGCTTREQFYEAIINTYTIEENYLYDTLNTALRRQKRHGYRPTALDLAIGPYVVVYQMLLLFWSKLKRERGTCYRRMKVSERDLGMYVVGTRFVWLSFVSSSLVYEKAIPFPTCGPSGDKTIIFTIDNTDNSPWQPRNIEKYSQYMERERVYPAGAKFMVTKRRTSSNGDTKVCLKLLSN